MLVSIRQPIPTVIKAANPNQVQLQHAVATSVYRACWHTADSMLECSLRSPAKASHCLPRQAFVVLDKFFQAAEQKVHPLGQQMIF